MSPKWLVITLAVLSLGALSWAGNMFCATAGELGVAGEPPDLAFAVFEGGVWRPARAYVQPENVTFLFVPLLVGNKTNIQEAALAGQLPPPRLRNDTLICFEAARGIPPVKLPAAGLLVVLEKGSTKYHVFITRIDAATPANFTILSLGPLGGDKPTRVTKQGSLPRPVPRQVPKETTQREVEPFLYSSTTSLSYWASFKLYKAFGKDLAPRGYQGRCVSFTFDTPAETSDAAVVLIGGTTPGTYSYYIVKRQGRDMAVWGGSVQAYSGPNSAFIWLGPGRANYRVEICNENSYTARIYVTALLMVSNQPQYLRIDTIKMPRAYIYIPGLFEGLPINNYLLQNSCFTVPGFYVDAASNIVVDIYLRVPKYVASTTLYVYWGPLYLGSISGRQDPLNRNYLIFDARLYIPRSLYWYILPTNGLGGAISICPIDARYPFSASIRVWMYNERPVELAPAGDSFYVEYLNKRLKETTLIFTSHSASRIAYSVNLEFMRYAEGNAFGITATRFDLGYTQLFGKIRYYIKTYDSSLNEIFVSAGATQVYTTGSGWRVESLQYVSLVLSLYDLAKSTIDALKRVASGFPVIGYITLLLDSFASQSQASLSAWTTDAGKTLVIQLNIPLSDQPLSGYVHVSFDRRPYLMEVVKVEVSAPPCWIDTPSCWVTVYEGSRLMPTTTTGNVFIPLSAASMPSQFPFRTLTCGAQEFRVVSALRCINDYFR